MMAWLRKVLGMKPKDEEAPPIVPPVSPALAAAQLRHRVLLTRADRAIQQAMSHADEAFGSKPRNTPHRRSSDR